MHVGAKPPAGEQVFRDDITRQILDGNLVREARRRELEYFESKQVWQLNPSRRRWTSANVARFL